MPLSHRMDGKGKRLLTLATGEITFAEVKAHLIAERADSYLGHPELIDAREATINFSSQEVRQIVDLLRNAEVGQQLGPTAVIVASDLSFGVLRMLQTLVSDVCMVWPFRSAAEAEQWLQEVGR
jgi:hypothetical protein